MSGAHRQPPIPAASNGLRRVTTGNPGADAILGGGFPSNSINVIMGAPGTGKTMFAQQLALHNADPERPVLYLTTLSEPLAKVVTYLQQLSFFDESKVGTAVRYEDLGAALIQHGIGALVSHVRDAIKRLSPHIIIIDSFKAIHDLSTSAADLRRFVSDLAGLLSAYDTTTFLVGEYSEDEISSYPEFAVADAIVELARRKRTTSDERYVRVSKLRGSAYREGLHGFRITAGGLEFYPRLVSPEFPRNYLPAVDRISIGIAGLDKMLGGGLLKGSCTLIAGPTGSGKTTTALQFALEGVRQGEPILFVNFQENPSQLGRAIEAMSGGLDEQTLQRWNAIYLSPVELQIDSLIGRSFDLIRETGIRRLVIDGIGDLLLAAGDIQRVHDYVYAFTQHLARNDVSSLLTFEIAMGHRYPASGLTEQLRFSALTDAIISLDIDATDRLRRTICVLKCRNSSHDLAIREMEITATGLRIA
jgi:circadian clock protein KaiC